jgi:GrpB-like predicted nucleotidyltransferase (UPF0157 family)
MMSVVLPPDPRWPDEFESERAVLALALADWVVDGIHHVGSTAVPGMPAKPIIDMVAGIRVLADADLAAPVLERLGYVRAVHRVDAVLFNKGVGDAHTHHLHLTVPGSDLWRERLAFRDALRADQALVAQYSELKAQLLREAGGRPYDARGKRDFVRRVLHRAGVELKNGLHVDPR